MANATDECSNCEALRAERDEARAGRDQVLKRARTAEQWLRDANKMIAKHKAAALADREAADAREVKLRAALEPFSEFAGYLFSKNASDDDIVAQTRVSSEFGAAVATLTFEAFRKARVVLHAGIEPEAA